MDGVDASEIGEESVDGTFDDVDACWLDEVMGIVQMHRRYHR